MNPALEPISVEKEIAGRTLKIETGRIARQAAGAVTVQYGETVVFVAVTTGKPRAGLDFFPLTVDYRETTAAAGKIPGGFFKREGRPTTKEILTCRLIDRPIRPLFPKGFKNDVMIQGRVFSHDGDNDCDILAMIATSAALGISKIPFDGPIGAARIGRIAGGELIVNPLFMERDCGDLDLVVAGTADAITMVESGCKELKEEEILEALWKAHDVCKEVVELINELVEKVGVTKDEFTSPEEDSEAIAFWDTQEEKLVPLNFTVGKHVRKGALKVFRDEAIAASISEKGLEGDEADDWSKRLKDVWEGATKKLVRQQILKNGKRADGRGTEDIRDIDCQVSSFPRTHGSSIFTRGETQGVVSATLGTLADEQRIEGLRGQTTKRFMLHYNFPSYCVGETWPNRGPKRREIGHGTLAERALEAVIPDFEVFPYSVRIVSEITESNGSSSMATVCGGTLALMDAGAPIRRPVAGIAMGLIKEGDDVCVLSDILGLEDACGDMDFKVAGTQRGITALQMDIKIKGLSREILEKALSQAKEGRFHILRVMLSSLPAPRPSVSAYAPKIVTLPIANEKIGALIGPGGKTIRKIQADTKTRIEVDDDAGMVLIAGTFESKMDEAVNIVRDLTRDVEIGSIYNGKVVTIKDFGAFVEILPGKEGLLPVEEFAKRGGPRINLKDHLDVGEIVVVKVIDVDPLGRVRLSKRAVKAGEKESVGA
ncbi:MAG: polyribonucleotide nucleotidyltransferase [Planctomycetota bacterium]|nr:polyribonucleotide nucleotidyltransferase [Planctomycetota bacterium]